MYKKAGIRNVQKFYEEKFAREFSEKGKFDICDFYLGNYNINFSKFFWIYHSVKPGSAVLDFGCGSGKLGALKRKGCTITGIDFSRKALEVAQHVNQYDSVFCGSIFDFKEHEASFDYIVSLDVFGHIPFEEKDATIAKLKKFLRPGGVMLHGIECDTIPYNKMSKEQLESFVAIDGHVGMEDETTTKNRFKKHFHFLETDVRFNVEMPADEFIKQSEQYGHHFDKDLLHYIRNLTPEEKFAFDIASGLIHLNMQRNRMSSNHPSGGFLYLRASDSPLDEPDFEIIRGQKELSSIFHDKDIFQKGWYEVEKMHGDREFRWGTNECLLCLKKLNKDLQLKIFSFFPEIMNKNVTVYFIDKNTGNLLKKITMTDNSEHTVVLHTKHLDALALSIFVDTTWKPALYNQQSDDLRILGIGISELRFL